MGENKPRRKSPVKHRILPLDPATLERTISSIHQELCCCAKHLKLQPHDYQNRRRLPILHSARANAWQKLFETDKAAALALAGELNLKFSEVPNE